LDKRKRKIRLLRGFFKLASNIRKSEEVNNSNLQPLFRQNLKSTLQQNRKETLFSFLLEDYAESADYRLFELKQILLALETHNKRGMS
jgi:hypothetical protein